MPDTIRLTEASLRTALRDDRHWNPGHPEREAYAAWVTDGYRALASSRTRTADGTRTVQVRSYQRSRKGVIHTVGEHTRGSPATTADVGGPSPVKGAQTATDVEGSGDLLVPTGSRGRGRGSRRHGGMSRDDLPRSLLDRPRRDAEQFTPLQPLPPIVGGARGRRSAQPGVPRILRERAPGMSGRERADDVPSWAQGRAPYVDETPEAFAGRMMDEQYPGGWRDRRREIGPDSEFNQLKKAWRGYRTPRGQ